MNQFRTDPLINKITLKIKNIYKIDIKIDTNQLNELFIESLNPTVFKIHELYNATYVHDMR